MGKICYLFGKSATGKDHIYREILQDPQLRLEPVVLYTTRPMRKKERDGVTYHFISEPEMKALRDAGKVIEMRTYETVCGPWSYATVDDGDWAPDRNYLAVGVLESYLSLRRYFGAERVRGFYIEVEDGERLQRALNRERKQPKPNYSEVCRRFLADQRDFSEERLREAGIGRRYRNDVLQDCVESLRRDIRAEIE